jgi:hypothetical protein
LFIPAAAVTWRISIENAGPLIHSRPLRRGLFRLCR